MRTDAISSTQAQHSEILCSAFSLVIPAYNKEHRIISTLNNLRASLDRYGCEYEIIVVDDASSDGTSDLLRSQLDVRTMKHQRHRGYGAALKTAIRQAKYPLIVITDADGIYPNEIIPQLVTLMSQAGVDMIVPVLVGVNVEYSNFQKISNWFLIRFAEWITVSSIPDLNSGLRVFRKDVAEKLFNILPDTFIFNTTLALAMLTNNYTVHYEPISDRYGVEQRKNQPIKDTVGQIELIIHTGIYIAPLRFLLPVAGLFFAGFLLSLFRDTLIHQDLSQHTLFLFLISTQLGIFALLADMIDKKNRNHT